MRLLETIYVVIRLHCAVGVLVSGVIIQNIHNTEDTPMRPTKP